ncbi:MAG TPA: hypothetical protein VEH06_10810 [Candidatus Bathyarchaeia archaeon]|nr:hypothetical protein [Candidatus Bathyarchaeia archaeon]
MGASAGNKDYCEPKDNHNLDSVKDYLESKFRDIYDTQKFQIVQNGIEEQSQRRRNENR